MPPTKAVAYGETSSDVKQLQQFLMAQGLSIPAGATGYFGDQTKQALQQWQTRMGITGAGVGTNWGPQSMAAASKGTSTPNYAGALSGTGINLGNANTTPSGASLPSAASLPKANSTPFYPTPTGGPITSSGGSKPITTTNSSSTGSSTSSDAGGGTTQTVPQVPPIYAMVGAAIDQIQNKASLGTPVRDFSQALDEAAKDPRIVAKYGDMAKMDTQAFTQSLQSARELYSSEADQRMSQFEQERKDLAEKQAAAGTAYSGFRGQAEEALGETQAGIVTSSRAQQKQFLNSLTSAFESKYGTGATPVASLTTSNPLNPNVTISGLATTGGGTTTLTGQQAGGITGTVPLAKNADIASMAGTRYNADNPAPM